MNYYTTLAIVLWVYMTLWFVVSLIKQRNDVADIAWGLGFVLVAWVSLLLSQVSSRGIVVAVLISIWGFRLASHIYARNRGKGEDYRYAEWRAQWGRWFVLRSYAQVYVLQGVLLYIIALPTMYINYHSLHVLGALDYIGVAVWLAGFWCESTADKQLAAFVHDVHNKGKILQTGLWKYSRHPNYFGEVSQWWGIWILALGVPGAWWTVVGPATITCLILFVSGVPMLEKKMAEKPEFAEYKRRTSVLVPWWPKV